MTFAYAIVLHPQEGGMMFAICFNTLCYLVAALSSKRTLP